MEIATFNLDAKTQTKASWIDEGSSLNTAFSLLMAPILKRAEKENQLHTILGQSRLQSSEGPPLTDISMQSSLSNLKIVSRLTVLIHIF